jgi:sulfite exporter TauE/SafE
MTWAILSAAFLLGLASNVHCIGMCGPIAMAIPIKVNTQNPISSKFLGVFLYNIGRVITYSFLGLIAGIAGISIQLIGFLQGASIVAGILIILFAWRGFFPNFGTNKFEEGVFRFIRKQFKVIRQLNSTGRTFLFGVLNGILPCGMVYLALLNSLVSPSIELSVLAMMVFGLGTLPAMIAISFLGTNLQQMISKYKIVVPVLITIVGLLSILRGANLGIPMLSPERAMMVEKVSTPESEVSSPKNQIPPCCRKKEVK